jgi:5-oxoprolinase (ATP-hydrolysing)
VEKGHDVTKYVLTTFGGAGGQHACAVADSLGMRTVLIPPMAGVLSALGIGLADTTVIREQAVEVRLGQETIGHVVDVATSLESVARSELTAQGVSDDRVRVIARAQLRYDGTDSSLTVELADPPAMVAAFETSHRNTYSFLLDRPLIVESVSVEGVGLTPQPNLGRIAALDETIADAPQRTVRLWSAGSWRDVALFERERMPAGMEVSGPAIIAEANATTVVDDGWQGLSGLRPTRSCWRSSTTSSCRSPSRWVVRSSRQRSRSTFASDWTSRARCSTPKAT